MNKVAVFGNAGGGKTDVPGLRFLGRRRAWMLLSQASIMLGLIALAFGDPFCRLTWTVAGAFLLPLPEQRKTWWRMVGVSMPATAENQGMMSAAYQLGYRLALLCASAGALYLADAARWKAAYLAYDGQHRGLPSRSGVFETGSAARDTRRGLFTSIPG